MKSLKRKDLHSWIIRLLESTGMSRQASSLGGNIFLRASLRHTGHHDITYLPERLELLNNNTINPKGVMTLLQDNPVFSRYDGQGALGEYCCAFMLQQSIEKAKTYGLALSTVQRSNHFLAGHPYGQIAAEQNCMALIWSNTDPCMGDAQGQGKVIGNNPIGFGAPGLPNPMIVDLCMAYTSLGNIHHLLKEGKEIPSHWGRDAKGNPTTDPSELLHDGVPMPMGEHKGFGLSLMTELLTGGLSGGEMGTDITPIRGWQKHSQTMLVIDLEKTGVSEDWNDRIQSLRNGMNKKATGKVRFPGDHLYSEASQDKEEVHIPLKVYNRLKDYCEKKQIKSP